MGSVDPNVLTPVDAAELARRVIQPDAFVADTEAFVDVRLPRSKGKASYSFIGPGVSQNADQVINLAVAHGFNIGAASMPHGVVNNPHLHFTAEVFVCTAGHFRFSVGRHGETEIDVRAGDVLSVPTWTFRGFENLGGDDGWLFTVLGGDDTGGIIWAPEVLRDAAETGLYLTPEFELFEAPVGSTPDRHLEPLDDAELASIDIPTPAELRACLARPDDLVWSTDGILTGHLPGHASAIAPVLGNGVTADRHQHAKIPGAPGFSIDRIRLEAGASLGWHRLDDDAVVLCVDGGLEVALCEASGSPNRRVASPGAVVSLPAGSTRDLTNHGDVPVEFVLVADGDHRSRLRFDQALVQGAREVGVAIDANGHLAPAHLIRERESA